MRQINHGKSDIGGGLISYWLLVIAGAFLLSGSSRQGGIQQKSRHILFASSACFHEKASQEVRLRTPHYLWRVPERHASIRIFYGSAFDPVHFRVRRGAAYFCSNSFSVARLATGSARESQSPGRDVNYLC